MRMEVSNADHACALDVYCIAKTLVEKHGADAVLVAARWSDCASRAGDPARANAWRRIVGTVAGMLSPADAHSSTHVRSRVSAVAA